MSDTKPCVICDAQLHPVFVDDGWKNYQPSSGGEIKLIFGYGSMEFDLEPGHTEFRGVICDDCAKKLVPKMTRTTH